MFRLITDFDGPIMDVSDRYYRVYQDCLQQIEYPRQQIRQLSKSEFWQLKRSRSSEEEIGVLSGLEAEQVPQFARMRRATVHQLEYLVYDLPSPGAIETLEKLQQSGIDLVVMTMRRVKELKEAFDRCNLERFFARERCYCLSDDYQKTSDVKDKPLLMGKALEELPQASDVWMVGDTEADIVAAKTHDIKVIAVLSGIRDRSQLERYEPNFIVNNFAEAADLFFANIGALCP